MRGVDVRNLEDLRKNFELDAAIDYFKNGKLLKLLEARYYDDEADKIAELNENAPDLREKLCAVFGVECNEEFNSARLAEKKNILRGMTDNESIINNAATTALNQEDLAELLDADTSTIYLCGNIFTVPIRVRNKKYIGIFDPPAIKIRANSQAELDDKNISFENVILPFDISAEQKVYTPINQPSTEDSRMLELRDTFEVIFGIKSIWTTVDDFRRISTEEPTSTQKKTLIRLFCGKEYDEKDIVHLCAMKDLSAGRALTKDAFCFGGEFKLRFGDLQQKKILYKNIAEVWNHNFTIVLNSGTFFQLIC